MSRDKYLFEYSSGAERRLGTCTDPREKRERQVRQFRSVWRTQEIMARPGGLELPTFWFVAVRPALLNLARGVANRTESASWGKFPQPAFSFLYYCLRQFSRRFLQLALHFRDRPRSCRTRHGADPVERAYAHILKWVNQKAREAGLRFFKFYVFLKLLGITTG